MVNPSDLLTALVQYGNIAYEYLRKNLTNDQIAAYLDYLHSPTTTYGEAFRHITEEQRHPEAVFYALESLGRINALCNAAECPSESPITPDRAFIVAVSALWAGMLIGAVVDDKGKEAILALAKHGKKFAESVGKNDDEFTSYLVSLFQEFHKTHDRHPRNKEVIALLESCEGQGFIHTINDDVIEWGDRAASTKLTTLPNRLTRVRDKLGISRNKKITVAGKP